ncbi:hypothetical protein CC77DRAFT_79340 [Alternaria alternata]|uniref:Nephrocystin 3-like N-terminal domain-containing protein n=1 Tax=Alternaria alternata TaxID=5599 RepID=A0A177DNF0_ALTAL|nr:hypothetical protein CC77DRAFT_79340 [Alternaria alternata]OAG20740.1 hypothetical protein CC77DRAFT_79340 [Alternaria alternata]
MNARATGQTIGFNNEGGRIAIQAAEYHVHGDNIVNQAQEGDLEKLPYAAEAPFNAYNRQHDPECLPSTRTALLDDIYAWTDGLDERCVYWLNGLAGTGKSTVARTVARRHYERRSLGASFFFARGGGDLGHARKFVTSIAVQLAYNVPVSRQHICDAIAERPDISDSTLRDQWQQLVLRPLSALNTLGNITALVLVIDALDECDDDDDIQVIIGLLAEAQLLSGPKMRVFLTSRPEVAIRHSFYDVPDASHQCFVLHHIASSVVDADIELFLKHNLAITGREQRLPADWPGSEIIAKMVQRASGLFIWAATAHKFIRLGGRRFAARRLESIIKDDCDPQAEPEKHLDTIYTTILRNSIRPEYTAEEKEEHCEMLRHILGSLVVMKSPLTARSLGGLLDMTEENIRSTLEDLHAILDVPADDMRPLRIHHPSLRDFLLDRSRCTDADFWVDEAQIHTALASRCMILIEYFFENDDGSKRKLVSKRYEDLTSRRTMMMVVFELMADCHEEEANSYEQRAKDILEVYEQETEQFGKDVKGFEETANSYEESTNSHEKSTDSHEESTNSLENLSDLYNNLLQLCDQEEKQFRKDRDAIEELVKRHRSIKTVKSIETAELVKSIKETGENYYKSRASKQRKLASLARGLAGLARGLRDEQAIVSRLRGEASNGLKMANFKSAVQHVSKFIRMPKGHGGIRLDSQGRLGECDEAFDFTELYYAGCNWARHLERSELKVVDGGQAHTFFTEYVDDWAMMLVICSEAASCLSNILCLLHCISEDSPQLLDLVTKKTLEYCRSMTSFSDLLEDLH